MSELISYTLTEIGLAGVGLLGLIESIRLSADNGRFNDTDDDNRERKYTLTALQVETAVNFVAAFVYAKMIAEYKNNPKSKIILQLRYADWVFTTPLLLLSLSLFMLKSHRPQPEIVEICSPSDCSLSKEPSRWYLGLALSAAVAMCVVGYRAELKRDFRLAVVSFVFLVAAFGLLVPYIGDTGIGDNENIIVYSVLAFLWCCYGFVWFIKNEQKRNIAYNSLDLLSKVGFGLYLWVNIRGIM